MFSLGSLIIAFIVGGFVGAMAMGIAAIRKDDDEFDEFMKMHEDDGK